MHLALHNTQLYYTIFVQFNSSLFFADVLCKFIKTKILDNYSCPVTGYCCARVWRRRIYSLGYVISIKIHFRTENYMNTAGFEYMPQCRLYQCDSFDIVLKYS